MTQIGNHDDAYLSTPLEEKLAWFQNAPGLSAVEPARQFMAGAAALYTDSDSQVRATMRGLGVDWTGDAATNAGATLQRAADWSRGAAAGHSATGQTVEGYGQSFEALRGQVHWDDPWAWGWRDTATAAASVAGLDPGVFLGNLTTDYFTTAQQNRTNDASAVAALRAHEQQTRAAVDSFPALAPAGIDPPSAAPGPHSGGGSAAAGVSTAAAVAAHPTDGTNGAGLAAGSSAAPPPASAVPIGLGVAGLSGQGSPTADRAGGGSISEGGTAAPVGLGAAGAGGRGSPTTREPPGAPGKEGSATRPGGLGGVGPSGSTGEGTSRGAFPDGAGGLGPSGSTGGATEEGVSRGALPGEPRPGLRPGARTGGPIGTPLGGGALDDGAAEGQATGGGATARSTPSGGGWREVVPRGPAEPGTGLRSPGAGSEFGARLPSGSPESTSPIAGRGGAAGMPYLGGMGGGAGRRSTEHRHAYWIRSSEPFDVPLPPHGDGVLQGSEG